MNVQVLVAAMDQKDHKLLEKMNIQTDAIVGNQADYNAVESFEYLGHKIKYLSFAERGVGLNRNNALMRADGDIIVFADDDMVYVDNYAAIIERAYEELPNADVIIFNLIEDNPKRYLIPRIIRVGKMNYLRYGAARITAKNNSIKANGIHFYRCFGGGTEHSCGEDNLFLSDCLKKGLKVYAYPAFIAKLTEERPSTWNTGDIEKYLIDKGILFRQISRRFWWVLCLQDALRRHRTYKKRFLEAYQIMTQKHREA